MGKSRAAEHQAFLSWLLKQIKKMKVDALIVAGDIFDTGSPPSYARKMYNRFVVDMHHTGCQFIVLAGNHDSVATLGESSELLACLNTHVISCVNDPETNDPDSNAVFPLKNLKGEVSAVVCAVPFIRPRDVIISQAGQSGGDKQQAMQQAISDYYHRLYKKAVKERKKLEKKAKTALPIIATGHLTTVGASTSDSVREIYIGTLDAFPASGFPPVDYLALGHIHQSQKVAKTEHLRYSGSPIPLSFDESKMTKSVLLVDFEKGKFKQAKSLDIPSFQAMKVIKGDLKSIKKQLNQLAELTNGEHVWVEILVSSQDYLNDLQTRIEEMIEGLALDVLRLRRERQEKPNSLQQSIEKETLNELEVMDVFDRRLSEENWDKSESQEGKDDKKRVKRLKKNFKQVVAELEAGEESL